MRIRSIAALVIAMGVLPHSADTLLAHERANSSAAHGAVRRNIVDAAAAMPADKFGFALTTGEFSNVRTFGREIKRLAATNYILIAPALGESASAHAGDKQGLDSVITKTQRIAYLERSFDALATAIEAIGDGRIPVKTSPICPFQGGRRRACR